MFYSINCSEKKGSIEIDTKLDYSTKSLIPLDSELIVNNEFTVAKGKKFMDIAQFTYCFIHFAISERFKKVLESNNIKGWTCFPITIKGYEEKYYIFQVTSCAGPILNLKAIDKGRENNRKFDLSTWDGSGIFTLKDTTSIVCSEEVKKIILQNNVTNIDFEEY